MSNGDPLYGVWRAIERVEKSVENVGKDVRLLMDAHFIEVGEQSALSKFWNHGLTRFVLGVGATVAGAFIIRGGA